MPNDSHITDQEQESDQKRLFGSILDFEMPVDFCYLSKVILEVFFFTHSFLIYLVPQYLRILLYLNFV